MAQQDRPTWQQASKTYNTKPVLEIQALKANNTSLAGVECCLDLPEIDNL